jgi:hypothetical protein
MHYNKRLDRDHDGIACEKAKSRGCSDGVRETLDAVARGAERDSVADDRPNSERDSQPSKNHDSN